MKPQTIELVRSYGVEPVTSAELVQKFEAVFSPAQYQMHVEASEKMHRIIQEAFAEIARRIRAGEPTTEWDVAQFMLRRYKEEGMEQEPMIVAVNANTDSEDSVKWGALAPHTLAMAPSPSRTFSAAQSLIH